MSDTQLVTIIYPLYNTAHTAEALVAALVSQAHPDFPRRETWLSATFVDDHSTDRTFQAFTDALAHAGHPANIQLLRHEQNTGLARTLNEGFRLARTPFVVSCHCDCVFAAPDTVFQLLTAMNAAPEAAAITGQQTIDLTAPLSFPERVNLVSNLMDIFPELDELVPVAFAEGRCDIFRRSIMERVGFYDDTQRTSGEDQLLAVKIRDEGFHIYKASRARYHLGVSTEQNSITKLIRHHALFGATVLLPVQRTVSSRSGYARSSFDANRLLRSRLRILHLGFGPLLLGTLLLAAWGSILPLAVTLVSGLCAKWFLFRAHLRVIPFAPTERIRFWALQPVFDVAYSIAFYRALSTSLWSRLRR